MVENSEIQRPQLNIIFKIIMIGLIIHAITLIYQIQKIYINDFVSGRISVILHSDSTNNFFQLYYISGFCLNIGISIYEIYLFYLLKNISPKAPTRLILFFSVMLGMILFDIIASQILISEEQSRQLILIGQMIRLIVTSIALIYVLKSKNKEEIFNKHIIT